MSMAVQPLELNHENFNIPPKIATMYSVVLMDVCPTEQYALAAALHFKRWKGPYVIR